MIKFVKKSEHGVIFIKLKWYRCMIKIKKSNKNQINNKKF
jgi:hypothetical protein